MMKMIINYYKKKKLFPILAALVLARKGKAIYARSGKDVLPDYDEAAVDLELPEECYVGLFLCSHEEDVVETGHFRNVVFKQ